MIAEAIVAAALLTAAPSVKEEPRARYAEDIAAVVDDIETAHALVATGVVESGFRPAIERCECGENECDRDGTTGKPTAIGLYQLHWYHWGGHTPAQICANNRLSTELAARALLKLKARVGTMREAMRVFIGRVSKKDPRLVRRLAIFDQLTAAWEGPGARLDGMVPAELVFGIRLVAEPSDGPALRENASRLPSVRRPERPEVQGAPPSALLRAHWSRRPRDSIMA